MGGDIGGYAMAVNNDPVAMSSLVVRHASPPGLDMDKIKNGPWRERALPGPTVAMCPR